MCTRDRFVRLNLELVSALSRHVHIAGPKRLAPLAMLDGAANLGRHLAATHPTR